VHGGSPLPRTYNWVIPTTHCELSIKLMLQDAAGAD
jgi:hypothetical protein